MRASFVCAAVIATLAGCMQSPSQQAKPTSPPTPEQPKAGTVETIAGPGFCPGTSIRDRSSEEVGALALDREGRIFFETGPRADGVVARVEPDGRVAKVKHLTQRGPYEQSPASLAAPAAGRIAADGASGVYIAAGSKLVHLDRQGALRNIAGDPRHPPAPTGSGSSGDGGPAEAARFSSVRSVITDEAGNLFLADQGGGASPQVTIRFINRGADQVTFYRGTPLAVTVQPGHIATVVGATAEANLPAAKRTIPGGLPVLALAGSRLYVGTSSAEPGSGRFSTTLTLINISGERLGAHGGTVEPGGTQQLLPEPLASKRRPESSDARSGNPVSPGAEPGGAAPAGGAGVATRAGEAGAATPAASSEGPRVRGPISGLAANAAGSLYLADAGAHRVLEINSAGVREVFAGAAGRNSHGFNGNDRRARGARLNRPFSLAVGAGGRVYISDQKNHQVRFVDEAGVIRVAPGAGIGLIWKCTASTMQAAATPGADAGRAIPPAPVPLPGGPAYVAAGNGKVFFTNSAGHQLKVVETSNRVTNVAGDGRPAACRTRSKAGAANRTTPLAKARLSAPSSLALGSGGIYVADCDNARISFINPGPDSLRVRGTTVAARSMMTVAGSGIPGFEGDGEKASEAALGGTSTPPPPSPAHPILEDTNAVRPEVPLGALATDAKGSLYIADTGNGRVRRVDSSGVISTIAGEGVPGSLGDCCRRPSGLAVDQAGNLYVLDVATLKVWFLNQGRLPVSVKGVGIPERSAAPVAGNGGIGFEGEGGPAVRAQLLFPMGIALDGGDNLYIVEVSAALGTTLFDPVIRGVDVRKVDSGGTIRTILGPGHVGFNGDGLKPSLTSLVFPIGIAADRCGNLLIADLGNDRVRRANLNRADLQAEC